MPKNTFLYKGDEAELFEESEVEGLLADGWFDNPSDAKATGEPEVKDTAPDNAAPKPVTVEVAEGPKKRGPKPKKQPEG